MGRNAEASGRYSTAMGNTIIASGEASTAMGNGTKATGDYSTAMGSTTTASGWGSTAMGFSSTASGGGSFAVGYATTASGNRTTAMGHRASTNNREGSFIYGDNSTTNFLYSNADNQFMVRAAGGTIFYSNSTLTSGVSLSAGGGAWAIVSDKNKKENFKDINSADVLEKLSKINIQSWNYKSQNSAIKHVGITAQDFYQNFGFGENDTTLIWMDVVGINSIAIQELYHNYQDVKKENQELIQKLEIQDKRNTVLENRLNEIEKLLKTK